MGLRGGGREEQGTAKPLSLRLNSSWVILGFPLVTAAVLFGYDLRNGSQIVKTSLAGHNELSRGRGTEGTGLTPRWDARTMLKLAWFSLPLGIILTMIALTTSIPRYMVSHYLSTTALGIFVSIAYLGMVGRSVVLVIGQSAGPRLAKYYAAGNTTAYCRLLGKMLRLVIALGAAVVLVVALLGGPILSLLYGADYTPYLDLAVYLMVAAAVTYLTGPLGIAVAAMRPFKSQMVIRGVGIVVLLALLPRFLQAHGLKGAVAAMFISYTLTVPACACVVF